MEMFNDQLIPVVSRRHGQWRLKDFTDPNDWIEISNITRNMETVNDTYIYYNYILYIYN